MHDFPLTEAENLQVPYDQLGRIDILKRKPMLDANIKKAKEKGLIDQKTAAQLATFLLTIKSSLADKTKALVHGDLHIRNMLVNESGTVSAIIDWGDTHIGRPAVDLSIAYSFLPAEGRNRFFEIYGEVSTEVKAIAKFKAVYTIIILLLYADDLNDTELLNDSITSLQMSLEE